MVNRQKVVTANMHQIICGEINKIRVKGEIFNCLKIGDKLQ